MKGILLQLENFIVASTHHQGYSLSPIHKAKETAEG